MSWHGAGLVFLILVLWIGGFIGSFWVGIGIAAMIGIVVIIQKLPKFQQTAMWIFGGWIVLFLILPPILNLFPYTQKEWRATRSLADLIAGERMHPSMGRMFRQVKNRCDWWEEEYTKQITIAYQKLSLAQLPLIKKEIDEIYEHGRVVADGRTDDDALPSSMLVAKKAEVELNEKLQRIYATDEALGQEILRVKQKRDKCKAWILEWAPTADVRTPTDWLGWLAVLLPAYLFALAMAWSVKKPIISKVAEALVLSVFLILAIQWIATDGFLLLKDLVGAGKGEFAKGRGLYWILIMVLSGVTLLSGLWQQKLKVAVGGAILVFLLGLGGDWINWQEGSVTKAQTQIEMWRTRPGP